MSSYFADVFINSGIRVTAIDGGHMSHKCYDSTCLVFEIVDGNFRNIPLSVALVQVENNDNYQWFLRKMCEYPGMFDLLN